MRRSLLLLIYAKSIGNSYHPVDVDLTAVEKIALKAASIHIVTDKSGLFYPPATYRRAVAGLVKFGKKI